MTPRRFSHDSPPAPAWALLMQLGILGARLRQFGLPCRKSLPKTSLVFRCFRGNGGNSVPSHLFLPP